MGLWAKGPWSSFLGSMATIALESPASQLLSASTWARIPARSSKASLGRSFSSSGDHEQASNPWALARGMNLIDHVPQEATREGGHARQIGEWESLGLLLGGAVSRAYPIV